jgi:23S rRNA (guanine745-N1)-methyltransferase
MSVLMCPVCRQALNLIGRTWRCEQGHSYDLAKQGYVNLHVVQHKHSKTPGDTPESVLARRLFLSKVFTAFTDAVVVQLQQLQLHTLLDIGCGEGYTRLQCSNKFSNVLD